MTLLDTNNDSKSDIVFIREYENMTVESATATKIQGTSKKIIRLDNVDYDLYQGYNKIEPTSLKKWDVISIIKTPTEDFYEMYMTRSVVKGKVTTIATITQATTKNDEKFGTYFSATGLNNNGFKTPKNKIKIPIIN
jgi:glutathione synthase/RimK-type ligase-like ATP-grasp enzyme